MTSATCQRSVIPGFIRSTALDGARRRSTALDGARRRSTALDGARYLREQRWPERIVNLVAHHSGARFEAIERGLADDLAEFPFEESPAHDALATADLTTGPGGEPLTYDQRVTDNLDRYPENDAVHRTWVKAGLIFRAAAQRTEERTRARRELLTEDRRTGD